MRKYAYGPIYRLSCTLLKYDSLKLQNEKKLETLVRPLNVHSLALIFCAIFFD